MSYLKSKLTLHTFLFSVKYSSVVSFHNHYQLDAIASLDLGYDIDSKYVSEFA